MKGAFPTLDVRLSAEWSAGLCKRIVAGDIDAAAILTHPSNTLAAPTVGRHVATLDIVIVQSRRLPLVKGPVPMSRLAGEGWILNPKGCGYPGGARTSDRSDCGRSSGGRWTPSGPKLQFGMISPPGSDLGVVPRSVLKASVTREGLSIVDVVGLLHESSTSGSSTSRTWGNLRRAVDPARGDDRRRFRAAVERIQVDNPTWRPAQQPQSKPESPRRRRPGEDLAGRRRRADRPSRVALVAGRPATRRRPMRHSTAVRRVLGPRTGSTSPLRRPPDRSAAATPWSGAVGTAPSTGGHGGVPVNRPGAELTVLLENRLPDCRSAVSAMPARLFEFRVVGT